MHCKLINQFVRTQKHAKKKKKKEFVLYKAYQNIVQCESFFF